MDPGYFPVIAGAIYIGAGICYQMRVFPPTKRKLVGFGFDYNRFIVPDRWTMPATGFDALENPRIWYPGSKRTSLLVTALGCLFALFWLAPRFLLKDRVDEDRIFLAFLIGAVAGQGFDLAVCLPHDPGVCAESRSRSDVKHGRISGRAG